MTTNNSITFYQSKNSNRDIAKFKALLYEDNELFAKVSKYTNDSEILVYKSKYDGKNNIIVIDFAPENLINSRVARASFNSRRNTTKSFIILLNVDRRVKGAASFVNRTSLQVSNKQCSFKDNKLIIDLSDKKQKTTHESKNVNSSADIESQCHKLIQVLPEVMVKKLMDSDELATKLANTVDYRTNRDLKALEKTLLEEMDRQQEEMEKKLSDQLAAGLKEMQDQLTDWLNR